MTPKSTVDEIRARFDADVERFSSRETGQSATIDAPLVLDLLPRVALAATPGARSFLDIGCGAGNFSLAMRERSPDLSVTLVDLSGPMLVRAVERLGGAVTPLQGDIREVDLGEEAHDVAVAAASLHHLREGDEWRLVFGKIHRALRPGGGFWISDLVEHAIPAVQTALWERYGAYLADLGGPEYRERVFAYIEAEDTPRSIPYQLDLLREVGFDPVEVVHKNGPFAVFGGLKAGE